MPPEPTTTIPYFAYGANLAAATLARRGIAPAPRGAIARVADPDTALVFGHRGGYATLANAGAPGAWRWLELPPRRGTGAPSADGLVFWQPYGALYELTEAQVAAIEAREVGYRRAEVEVEEAATGRRLRAVAFLSSPWMLLRRPVAPAARYRDILLGGARERGLPGEFQSWLEGGVAGVAPAALAGPEYSDTPAEAAGKVLGAAALVAASAAAAGAGH